MSAKRRIDNLYAGLFLINAITTIVAHAEEISAMQWAIICKMDERCPFCGYKLDHPIIQHEWPWLGHKRKD